MSELSDAENRCQEFDAMILFEPTCFQPCLSLPGLGFECYLSSFVCFLTCDLQNQPDLHPINLFLQFDLVSSKVRTFVIIPLIGGR